MGRRSILAGIAVAGAAICIGGPTSAAEALPTGFDLPAPSASSPSYRVPNFERGFYGVTVADPLPIVTFHRDPVEGGFDLDLQINGPVTFYLPQPGSSPTPGAEPYDLTANRPREADARVAPNTPVPEPASWAMMILGLGLIGVALRGFHVLDRRLERLRAPLR
jgi:hypothetical protein